MHTLEQLHCSVQVLQEETCLNRGQMESEVEGDEAMLGREQAPSELKGTMIN